MTSGISYSETLRQAMTALREQRRRTTLSVLGVAVGVAAVMIVGTITQTGRQLIFSDGDGLDLPLRTYHVLQRRAKLDGEAPVGH